MNESPFPAIRHLVAKNQLDRAMTLVAQGAVKSITATAQGYEGVIFTDTFFPYVASIKIDSDQVYGECSCLSSSPTQPLCDHVVALYIAANPEHGQLHNGDNRIILPAPGETLQEARQRELNRRKERAKSDISQVKVAGQQADGDHFEVISYSDQHYQITLRSREKSANDCSCPDLEINQLGTCKHIEAALLACEKTTFCPQLPVVYCDYEQGVPRLALLEGSGNTAAPGVLQELFKAHEPVYQEALSLDIIQQLQQLADNGHLVISRTAQLLFATIASKQQTNSRVSHLLDNIKQGLPLPGFKGQCSASQREALAFILSRPAALLTAPCGWGKTVVTLAAIGSLAQNVDNFRAIIVTTAALCPDWQKQAAQFLQLPVTIFQLDSALPENGLLICSFENALRAHKELTSFSTDLLVVDEAQYISNWRSPTGNILRQFQAERRLVLTGTDLLADPDAMFSIMQIVDDKVLGPLWLFNQRFITFTADVPKFHSAEIILAHLADHWWRRPNLQEGPADRRQIAHYYVDLNSTYRQQYQQVIEKLPTVRQNTLLTTGAIDLLDQTQQALYFNYDNRQRQTVAPKVELLIQLWRGFLAKTNRRYIVVARNDQLLNLAAASNNYLDNIGLVIYKDMSASSLAAKLDRFYNSKEASLLFCSDDNLSQLPPEQEQQTFIFFDIPWHPQLWQARLAATIGKPVIALVYQDTLEEQALDFYADHFADYQNLPVSREAGELLAPVAGPLATLLQDFLSAITRTEPTTKSTTRKSRKSKKTELDLFDFEQPEAEPAIKKTIELPNITEDILPATTEQAQVTPVSQQLTLADLLQITRELATSEKLSGTCPAELLRAAYNKKKSDKLLLLLHQLSELFFIISRGEDINEKLLERFNSNLEKILPDTLLYK